MSLSEHYDSRERTSGDHATTTLHYTYSGSEDDDVVMSAAESGIAEEFRGLVRQSIEIRHRGAGNWDVWARFGELSLSGGSAGSGGSAENEPIRQAFNTGGGTQHITQSIQNVQQKAKPGGDIQDHKGAIGFDGDDVTGTDITVPIYQWSETHILTNEEVNFAYRRVLYFLTGRMNQDTFRGFARGEVLFLGASGGPRDAETWELTFNFAASPNVTGLTLGDIGGIDKLGWDYLWIEYEKDGTGKRLVDVPAQANVERVYNFGDFAQLKIGVGEI